ncbi:MAG: energy-coupling factor transporter transmembrane component T family protein [Anaerolineae bacterium]
MGPSFDLYVPRRSWLHLLDPRTKLAFVGLVTALLLSFGHVVVILAFLAFMHLILLWAQIPTSRMRWAWGRMLPLSILIVLLWPLFDPLGSDVLLQVWRVRVTSESVLRGLSTALRVDALAFAFFLLLFSTDQARLVRGLVKVGLPYQWGLTLAIAMRYVPTFYGIYVAVTEAQQARGWIVGRGDFVKRLRSYLPVLVAVIITALRMTDNLAMALAARGLGGRPTRTYFREVHLGRADGVSMALLATLFVVMMVARLRYGFGVNPW